MPDQIPPLCFCCVFIAWMRVDGSWRFDCRRGWRWKQAGFEWRDVGLFSFPLLFPAELVQIKFSSQLFAANVIYPFDSCIHPRHHVNRCDVSALVCVQPPGDCPLSCCQQDLPPTVWALVCDQIREVNTTTLSSIWPIHFSFCLSGNPSSISLLDGCNRIVSFATCCDKSSDVYIRLKSIWLQIATSLFIWTIDEVPLIRGNHSDMHGVV